METVNLHLAHRWYIGYDLDEPVPDPSSLSKIRSRYGLAVFQRFFDRIVELCIEAGLVWGKELYFDGTKVRASAAMDSLVPRWYGEEKQKQHLQALFSAEPPTPEEPAREELPPEPAPEEIQSEQPTEEATPAPPALSIAEPSSTQVCTSASEWLVDK